MNSNIDNLKALNLQPIDDPNENIGEKSDSKSNHHNAKFNGLHHVKNHNDHIENHSICNIDSTIENGLKLNSICDIKKAEEIQNISKEKDSTIYKNGVIYMNGNEDTISSLSESPTSKDVENQHSEQNDDVKHHQYDDEHSQYNDEHHQYDDEHYQNEDENQDGVSYKCYGSQNYKFFDSRSDSLKSDGEPVPEEGTPYQNFDEDEHWDSDDEYWDPTVRDPVWATPYEMWQTFLWLNNYKDTNTTSVCDPVQPRELPIVPGQFDDDSS